MPKIPRWIVDLILIILFALLPGIRGYENWYWYEYALIALILAYILYLRHKTRQER